MPQTIEAVFDGTVFRPIESIHLKLNTRVRIAVESTSPVKEGSQSFLQTARSLNLEGPADWSANLEEYLYGKKKHEE